MLLFDLFCNDFNYQERKVSLNPQFIESVIETERRPAEGFFQPVAVITMDSGARHTVYDYDRTASKRVKEAQVKEAQVKDSLIAKLLPALIEAEGGYAYAKEFFNWSMFPHLRDAWEKTHNRLKAAISDAKET